MAQHLYLMQNEHGLLKVGRSADPERRRRTLETEEMCLIEIVAVQEDRGDMEEEIHLELDEFRIIGEWFSGCDDARELALIWFLQPDDTAWPFEFDEKAAAAWLDRVEEWRWFRSVRKTITTAILDLKSGPGSPYLDFRVWLAMWVFARQKNWIIDVQKDGLQMVYRGDDAPLEPLLPYTTDVAAALTLWPDGQRPARWLRSALDCCIAALRAELETLGASYKADRGGD